MGHQLTNLGEEFIIKEQWTEEVTKPTSVDIGLYDDTVDDPGDEDDLPLSSEPDDGNYARQSIDFGDVDMEADLVSGDWQVEFSDNGSAISFDVGGTTGDVDSWFIVIEFEAAGDSSPTDHLAMTGALSQSYDLGGITGNLNVENTGGSLD